MSVFSRIGLIGRSGSHPVAESLNTLMRLLQLRGAEVLIEEETAIYSSVSVPLLRGAKQVNKSALGSACDLVIVVGGDGSMLGAARVLCHSQVPVLGINRGSLGFLTDISPENIETLVAAVLDGKFVREERFLLDVVVTRNEAILVQGDAMNEIVVHRGTSLRMVEFSLYIDGQFVYSQHSDGLIVSTPTGSTAYALSGGGSILHPGLDAIELVPMFSHALTSRPIVVGGDSHIKIVMGNFRGGQPAVSCDGQNHLSIDCGDVIDIQKKPEKLTLIHPLDYNYYETCRTKLDWGSRLS
jgi:NAD+ kinase